MTSKGDKPVIIESDYQIKPALIHLEKTIKSLRLLADQHATRINQQDSLIASLQEQLTRLTEDLKPVAPGVKNYILNPTGK